MSKALDDLLHDAEHAVGLLRLYHCTKAAGNLENGIAAVRLEMRDAKQDELAAELRALAEAGLMPLSEYVASR